MHDYPDDDDGNTLKMLAENGFDMNQPLNIEFAVYAPDESSAKSIEKAMRAEGYKTEVYFDEGEEEDGGDDEEIEPSWTVYAYVKMIPEYEKIIQIQEHLEHLSSSFGGCSDGWGVFG